MEFLRGENGQTTIQAINLGYTSEYGNQVPVMVEFKTEQTTIGEDHRLQLFNMNVVQPVQVQYITQKYMTSETQTAEEGSYPEIIVEPVRYEKKPCPCTICGKRYANPKALKKHQLIHPEVVFDWQCRICNKTFPYKITMSRHLKLHAGEKLFKCENCQKRFETRYALVQHVKLHKSDVPFRCEMCEKPFLKHAEFLRHIRTHTGEKPFPCNYCDKAFTTRASFVKHSEKKHNITV